MSPPFLLGLDHSRHKTDLRTTSLVHETKFRVKLRNIKTSGIKLSYPNLVELMEGKVRSRTQGTWGPGTARCPPSADTGRADQALTAHLGLLALHA